MAISVFELLSFGQKVFSCKHLWRTGALLRQSLNPRTFGEWQTHRPRLSLRNAKLMAGWHARARLNILRSKMKSRYKIKSMPTHKYMLKISCQQNIIVTSSGFVGIFCSPRRKSMVTTRVRLSCSWMAVIVIVFEWSCHQRITGNHCWQIQTLQTARKPENSRFKDTKLQKQMLQHYFTTSK